MKTEQELLRELEEIKAVQREMCGCCQSCWPCRMVDIQSGVLRWVLA